MEWCGSSSAATNQNQGLHCANQSKLRLEVEVNCIKLWCSYTATATNQIKLKVCQNTKYRLEEGVSFGRIEWDGSSTTAANQN
jgi:hypothetical protein